MSENIYIKVLEYGAKNISKGLTYNELILYLNSVGIKLSESFEKYFHVWFYKNFWVPKLNVHINSLRNNDVENENYLKRHDDIKAILTSEAHSTYLDYLKLQQTRKDAARAHKLALTAIYISVVFALIQIILQVFDLLNKK